MKETLANTPREQTYDPVMCPNCNCAVPLKSQDADGWRTMDPLECIFSVTMPLIIALALMLLWDYGCNIQGIQADAESPLSIFITSYVLCFPIVTLRTLRYMKNRRVADGHRVWLIHCTDCGNTFRISRPIKNESVEKDASPNAETPVVNMQADIRES